MAVKKAAKPDHSDHPLAELIPSPVFYNGDTERGISPYISRTVRGIRDMDLLTYAHEVRKNVLLFGDTGPGKTAMVMAYCAMRGLPLVTIACNGGIDPNSFWGSYVFDEVTGQLAWQWADPALVIMHGGVLYLDEPNFMPPKTAASFHPLLDARRMVTVMERGNHRIVGHPDLFVIGSYNPDYEGTRPLNKAFRNRFKIKVLIDYSEEVEAKLVYMPSVLEIAGKLRAARKGGDLDTPCSTNMLVEFEELAVDLGLSFATDNFIAAFEADERDAVKAVFEMHSHDLTLQLEQMMGGYEETV